MKTVRVGLIGSGFAAELHAEAYRRVCGYDVRLKAVASTNIKRNDFAHKYGIGYACADYHALLDDRDIDVLDIVTPPWLHTRIARDALAAGKHVICEKPLTGYFGRPEDAEASIGQSVSKRAMYDAVIGEVDDFAETVAKSGRLFMYAENFIYAPALRKAVELLDATKSKILYMRGEESHSGSHARVAPFWKYSGGGSLIRLGCHPLSAVLYLKQCEARARGEHVAPLCVMGDVGITQTVLAETEKTHLGFRPADVEDLATLLVTFSDGTKATVTAGDVMLGGVRNLIEVFTNESAYMLNIAPNDAMRAYHADASKLDDVYFTEKLGNKAGWQTILLDEIITRGYVGEMQDFIECAAEGRQPASDFQLAADTIRLVYGGYLSAEKGTRFMFS